MFSSGESYKLSRNSTEERRVDTLIQASLSGLVQVFIEPLEGGAAGPVDDAWVADLTQQAGEPSCRV